MEDDKGKNNSSSNKRLANAKKKVSGQADNYFVCVCPGVIRPADYG